MSALPESLRPWATELSLFPEDLALSLGAHVARLAAALGPLRARSEVEGGEPQGYDGLTRRGSPERLLMSEWLMALEVPDEFVRRAAFGEQAFLRPAFRQPQGGRRVVALLDAGPDQLGAPRIAHLALLVVLARRAEAAGAGFAWGVLQSPPRKAPFTTVEAAAIGQWLKAASARPPSDEQLAAWREALQWGRSPDDVWLVGGARLSRLQGCEGLSRVAVEEVIAPGARRLAVEVRPVSRPSREVVLELPPAPQCVRLLRDPFGTAVVAPVLDRRTVRALRFSADGLRLLLANGDGGVTAQALPQSPSATLPKPKRFLPPYGETVVAMGWRRHGGLLAVTLHERTLRVHGVLRGYSNAQRVTVPLPEDESLRLPRAGEPPLLVMTLVRRQGREQPIVWDAAGTLHELTWDTPSPSPFPTLPRVSALGEYRGALLHVSRPVESASRMLRVGCESPGGEGLRVSLTLEGDGEAYFGHAKSSGPPLAVRQQPGRWWMMRDVRREEGTELSLPMGMRAVGLFSASGSLGLVTLGQDQRTFYRVSSECVPEVLMVAPARVVTASVSNALPVLAWLTEKGEVGVWNFQYRALVFHSTPGGAP
jgi:hypothetical protein